MGEGKIEHVWRRMTNKGVRNVVVNIPNRDGGRRMAPSKGRALGH